MSESLTIDTNIKVPNAQDYDFLRKEGIRLIEDLAGKVWSDYNTHDPGITLLEAMVYALTDLGYRTSFEIKDLISPPGKPAADTWKKIFFTAREALPCNPLTIIDYRKLIIDTEGVRNAWIEPSDEYEVLIYLEKSDINPLTNQSYNLTYDYKKGEDVLHLRGLYRVFVEYEDDVMDNKRQEDVATVIRQKLQNHRNLTEDFISVTSVEYEYFPVEATIQVSEGTDIEMINARIFKVIHDFFSPPIIFYSLEQMIEKGCSPEDIFEGPALGYGFIDTAELEKSERYKNIHLSDVISLISGIEGVIAVKKFAFPIESRSPFSNFTEWIDTVKDKQKTPKLDTEKSVITFERSGDRHRTDKQNQVNIKRVEGIFNFLKSDNFKTRLRGSGKDIPVPTGEFMDTGNYYPFQKNLPAAYGMLETFINPHDKVDAIFIATAVNELLVERAGVNGAKLINKLLSDPKEKKRLEPAVNDLIAGPVNNAHGVRQIIDIVLADETNDKKLKRIVREVLGEGYQADRNHLHNFVENNPAYPSSSDKTTVVSGLASTRLKKHLTKIENAGDIAKLNAYYKKYQVDQLNKGKKMVVQLRGFLMVFEQILADYLSQLAHTREIFSFDESVEQTFYPQVVEDINDLEALFIDFKHYKDGQLNMIQPAESFSARRNDILDHILARFSESMTKYSFFMQQFAGKEAGKILIADKVAFLSDYVSLSSYRGKGYNYMDKNNGWDNTNVEGIKKRICRLLGIRNYKREKIAPTALAVKKITLDNNVQRYIVTLTDPEDRESVLLKSKEFEFESEAIIILTYILENGYDKALYKDEGHGENWHFELKRLTPEGKDESIAYGRHYSSPGERNQALEKTMNTLMKFSGDENFHVLEHILLRPKIGLEEKTGDSEDVILLPVEYVPDTIKLADDDMKDLPYKFKITHSKDLSKKKPDTWKLKLMKNENDFLLVNEDFVFYKHVKRRMEHIREYASDRSNYKIEPSADGYSTFKIITEKVVLAESKKRFRKTEEIDQEINDLVTFLSYEFGMGSGRLEENNAALYADPYSFQLSIILPSWQRRFRSSTFRHLLEKTIYLETPSHIYPHVYWVDHDQMREFDEAYEVWVKEVADSDIPATDVVNNIITVLNKLKN